MCNMCYVNQLHHVICFLPLIWEPAKEEGSSTHVFDPYSRSNSCLTRLTGSTQKSCIKLITCNLSILGRYENKYLYILILLLKMGPLDSHN